MHSRLPTADDQNGGLKVHNTKCLWPEKSACQESNKEPCKSRHARSKVTGASTVHKLEKLVELTREADVPPAGLTRRHRRGLVLSHLMQEEDD